MPAPTSRRPVLRPVVVALYAALSAASAACGGGAALQLLASAATFGAAHATWGLFDGQRAVALGAARTTAWLGGALAPVYLAGGRSLAPCIAAHVLVTAADEPGPLLAAVRGEMRATRPTA